MSNFDHLIEVNAARRELIIYRIDKDGTKTLYTSTPLPEIDITTGAEQFQTFARELGENILLDSPAIRKIYSL